MRFLGRFEGAIRGQPAQVVALILQLFHPPYLRSGVLRFPW